MLESDPYYSDGKTEILTERHKGSLGYIYGDLHVDNKPFVNDEQAWFGLKGEFPK